MRLHRPSPALVVALVALVFSTTGLADAARHAIASAVGGHPVSTKPHAGGDPACSARTASSRRPRSRKSTKPPASGARRSAELEGTCPPDTVDIGTYCMESAPYPLTKEDLGKNNFIFASKSVRRPAAGCPRPRSSWARPNGQARVDDPRLPAHRHDRPRPHARAQRRTRDELVADDHRRGLGRGRLRGRQRRRHRQPPPGSGQPGPAAGQPDCPNRCST